MGQAVESMPRPAALKQRIWFTTAREALFSLFSSSSTFSSFFAYPHSSHIRLPVFVCHSRSSIVLSAPEFRNHRSSRLDFSSGLCLRLEIRTIRISLWTSFPTSLPHDTNAFIFLYLSLSLAIFELSHWYVISPFLFCPLPFCRGSFVSLLHFALSPIYWLGSHILQLSVWKLFIRPLALSISP